MGEVIKLPQRCGFHVADEHGVPRQCVSRNAIWNDSFQGPLCIVHEAGLNQSKGRHPAGSALPPTPPRRDFYTCGGCGMVANVVKGTPHACHRNEDGSYEEGGTFE